MGRPLGKRNPDYERKRRDLAVQLLDALVDADGRPQSMSKIAGVAGVSLPTLKHYFGSYDGVVEAAMQAHADVGRQHYAHLLEPGDRTLHQVLRDWLSGLHVAWVRFGAGKRLATGLSVGLGSASRGPLFVNHQLEPTLQAGEILLHRLQERGDIDVVDVRAAALALVGPVVLALLHQVDLLGSQCRPLDVDAFIDVHIDSWLKGHQANPES